MTQSFEKLFSCILLQQDIATKFDQMVAMDGEISFCREYTSFRVYPKTKALAAFPAGTIFGPNTEVDFVKILYEDGFEVAIPSICSPKGHILRCENKGN